MPCTETNKHCCKRKKIKKKPFVDNIRLKGNLIESIDFPIFSFLTLHSHRWIDDYNRPGKYICLIIFFFSFQGYLNWTHQKTEIQLRSWILNWKSKWFCFLLWIDINNDDDDEEERPTKILMPENTYAWIFLDDQTYDEIDSDKIS